jgi:hypothetical protein
VLLVHSLQTVYMPLPLDELDEDEDIPDEPDELDEDEEVIPDEPDDEPVDDELEELLLVVPEPVSSEQPPSASSVHEVTATANTPR